MNDRQKEVAARKLCELRGVDPDKSVAGGGLLPDLQSPTWRLALEEIEERLRMDEAISAGWEAQEPVGRTSLEEGAEWIWEGAEWIWNGAEWIWGDFPR